MAGAGGHQFTGVFSTRRGMPNFATRMNTALRAKLGTGRSSNSGTDVPSLELGIDRRGNVLTTEKDAGGISLATWDQQTGRLLSRKKLPKTESSYVGMFSSGGEYLMTGHVGDDPEPQSHLQLWRTSTGARHGEAFELAGGFGENAPLSISPDGTSLLLRRRVPLARPSESTDEDDPLRRRLPGGFGGRTRGGFGGGFRGGRSQYRLRLVVVNLATGEETILPEIIRSTGQFSSDSRFVLINTPTMHWRYDLQTGTLDPPLESPEVAESTASPAVSGGFRNQGRSRGGISRGPRIQSRVAARSSDGVLTATIVANSIVQIRPAGTNDPINGEEDRLMELPHPSPVVRVAFDVEGERILTAAADGLIRQWSLPQRWIGTAEEIRQRVERHTGVTLSETDQVVAVDDFAGEVAQVDRTFGQGSAQQDEPKLSTSPATFLTRKERDALRLRNEERWEEAESALKEWAALRPEDCQPIVLSLRPLVELKKFDAADTAWNEAVRRNGRDAAFAWLKADYDATLAVAAARNKSSEPRYNRLDANTAAIQGWYHRRLMEFAPDDATKATSLFQLAKIHEVKFEFDEAAEAINQAVALSNQSADIHYYRAHLMERLNRWDEALESRREFWRLEPDHQDSPYRVVTALVFADRQDEFRESWDQFLAESKERLEAASNVRFSNGLIVAAATRDRLAKPRLIAGGSHDESFQLALEMADANVDDPAAMKSGIADFFRLCKGLAEYRRGQPENLQAAVEILNTAFEGFTQPNARYPRGAAATRFIAAMALEKLGDHELAVATYLEGLDRHHVDGTQLRLSATSVWNDWQLAEVVRREAEELLKIDPNAIDTPVPDTSDWTVQFEDNFDDNISEDWQRISGEWSVVDGAACGILEQPEGGFEAYDRLEREFQDLPDTFELKYDTWTSAPMLASSFLRLPTDSPTPLGHRIALTSFPDRLLVFQGQPGTGVSLETSADFGYWINRNASDFNVEPGQHYKVRILRQPQRITVFVDGQQVLSERVRNTATRSIRFFARGEDGTKMFVDNVKIRVPPTPESPPKPDTSSEAPLEP